jgi:DNA-binding MarR family transcriptional regulator/GNAT superfamily N-acetyltransferase
MNSTELAYGVDAVRRFNRFYTKQIGLLHERLLRSPFSLSEARVIYELSHREKSTAAELVGALGLDAGYLSRILRDFNERGLIDTLPCESDGRKRYLRLSGKGKGAFARMNSRSHEQIEMMLNGLSAKDQKRLIAAMQTIEGLLGVPPQFAPKTAYILRPHQPGDMGWVVQLHGVLYAQEYSWDEQFEALVAEIVSKFIRNYDPKRERCWMAEKDGDNVGSIFLVRKTDQVAQLRLLLVDPKARGLGIGTRLVHECIRFARQAGYSKITLWTNSILLAARHIYEKAGFRLLEQEPHHSFGHDLIAETWELKL